MDEFVYKPPQDGPPRAINASRGVKFSQSTRILDEWYLLGGTKWSRTLFRLKHPIVYSKRGIKSLYRRVRRLFVKDKMIQAKIGGKNG